MIEESGPRDCLDTANAIEILLHCYCSNAIHPRHNAPAVQSEFDRLQRLGAIEVSGAQPFGYVFRTTALGDAWVLALCRVPLPRAAFIDECGRVL